MIHRYSVGIGDVSSPNTPLDLSYRMRELRARQGLKQSDVARRMGLDPSIPSLWEQGKRPVPASRVRALADALGVPLDELLEGVSGASRLASSVAPSRMYGAGPSLDEDVYPPRATPLLRLVATPAPADLELTDPAPAPPPVFQVAERPPLVGWIPDGWEPRDRIQDISPSLPDGYWLDPVRLERPSSKELLRSRLCLEDGPLVGEREVPGAALAERIYRHCSQQEGFNRRDRLPLIESIFRSVLAAEHGGLSDAALVETLSDREGAVPLTTTLLRRLRDSVRRYPMRSVDRQLFGA